MLERKQTEVIVFTRKVWVAQPIKQDSGKQELY